MRALRLVLALLPLVPLPAMACSIGAATPGTLALAANGQSFGSDSVGGVAALLTISNGVLDPAYTVTVSAPALTGWPVGFNAGAAQVSVAYTAVGVGVAVNQPMTASQTSFNAPNLAIAVAMAIQDRISSTAGFASGSYSTKVVVTCS